MARHEGRFNSLNFFTIVCVMILIGTEIFGIAFAGAWAIAGLFELGLTVEYILTGLFCLAGIWLMYKLWLSSVAVEPLYGSTLRADSE